MILLVGLVSIHSSLFPSKWPTTKNHLSNGLQKCRELWAKKKKKLKVVLNNELSTFGHYFEGLENHSFGSPSPFFSQQIREGEGENQEPKSKEKPTQDLSVGGGKP